MCVLCYELADEGHWSDVVLSGGDAAQAAARGRYRRASILTELLSPMGVKVKTPGPGRAVVVSNSTGASVVAKGLPAVWEAADRLGTRPLDPLAPDLLDLLEARRRRET
ncbi:MAG: hypothetical protein M3P96_06810 [Actinomycetota bacterium]|nr:hypothetical protein [Actinomycetota bacterium]